MGWQRAFAHFAFLALASIAAFSEFASGRILYVSYEGNNTPPYSSWETATFRVGLATPYALPGDTIKIAAGVYYDPVEVDLSGGLSLIGAGTDSTELRYTAGLVRQYVVNSGDLHIESIKFTATPGLPYPACFYFLSNEDTLRVKECIFEDYGRAIFSTPGYLDVFSSVFINCPTFDAGVTIRVGIGSGNGVISNCKFVSDRSRYYHETSIELFFFGAGLGNFEILRNVFSGYQKGIDCTLSPGMITIENNLFLNNTLPSQQSPPFSFDYVIVGTPNAVVRNNYFEGCYQGPTLGSGNTSLYIGGGISNHIYNNLFVGSQQGVRIRYESSYAAKANYFFDHNAFWIDSPHPHFVVISPLLDPIDSVFCADYHYDSDTLLIDIDSNLCRDPMFVDTLGYLLQAGSPCIDAGRPDIFDLDGSRSDIGPFGGSAGQFYVYQDLPPATPAEFTGSARSNGATLQWQKNSESDLRQYVLFKSTTDAISIDSAHIACYFPLDSDTLLRRTPDDLSVLVWNDSTFDPGLGARYTIVAVDSNGLVSQPANEVYFVGTAVGDEPELPLPQTIELDQNYPNPFNAATAIIYNLPNIGPQPARVRLTIYNILGQKVRVLVDEPRSPGKHVAYWDGKDRSGKDAPSGVYLYSLQVSGIDYVKNRRMVLIK